MSNRGIVPSFDWDQDGVADVFVVEVVSTLTTVYCYAFDGSEIPIGTTQAPSTQLHLLSGKAGSLIYTFGAPLPDTCWSGSLYPQWTYGSVIVNAESGEFAVSPYYASQSWIYKKTLGAGATTYSALYYPSTSSYATYYPNAKVVAAFGDNPDFNQAYIFGSHVFNGLFIDGALDFFTSGRWLSYSPDGLSPSQLNSDVPFVPSGIRDGAGRNYGLVTKDPASADVAVIAGCSVETLLSDTVLAALTTDPFCGIHRHVTRINSQSRQILGSDFYSYSNTGGTGAMNYEGRITYPSNAILRWPTGPSSLIYNSYSGGRWYMHVSVPGGTADLWRMKDVVVWDVIDIDQDGVDEILYSQTKLPTQPDLPGYYFPLRTTIIAHLTGASPQSGALTALRAYEGYLPVLAPSPKRDQVSSSEASLLSAVRVLGKQSALYFLDGYNRPVELEY